MFLAMQVDRGTTTGPDWWGYGSCGCFAWAGRPLKCEVEAPTRRRWPNRAMLVTSSRAASSTAEKRQFGCRTVLEELQSPSWNYFFLLSKILTLPEIRPLVRST